MTCPFCNSKNVSYETVDIGVGMMQCGPAECMNCGAAQVGNDISDVEWMPREKRLFDTSNVPAPWAVYCVVHGKRYLTREQYSEQMRKADEKWRCPLADCGRVAKWDDANYEIWLEERIDAI